MCPWLQREVLVVSIHTVSSLNEKCVRQLVSRSQWYDCSRFSQRNGGFIVDRVFVHTARLWHWRHWRSRRTTHHRQQVNRNIHFTLTTDADVNDLSLYRPDILLLQRGEKKHPINILQQDNIHEIIIGPKCRYNCPDTRSLELGESLRVGLNVCAFAC